MIFFFRFSFWEELRIPKIAFEIFWSLVRTGDIKLFVLEVKLEQSLKTQIKEKKTLLI